MKQFLLGLSVSGLILFSALGGAIADRIFVIKPLDYLLGLGIGGFRLPQNKEGLVTQKILKEESVVVDAVEKAAGSVVMVMNEKKTTPIDIGSGFVVGENLVVTSRHVVADKRAGFKIIDKENKEYLVSEIYRDPVNDIAILQIVAGEKLKSLEMGESANLKVGQFVIAIGTALGKFRETVTTGVVSGIGEVENLGSMIQTDAAINQRNSGGPLLNSVGKVIGINVVVVGEVEDIGFAIPIDAIKKSLKDFEVK